MYIPELSRIATREVVDLLVVLHAEEGFREHRVVGPPHVPVRGFGVGLHLPLEQLGDQPHHWVLAV